MPLFTTSRVPADFAETTAPANGITINYVRGGAGPTLVLLHGYYQTWYMWRKVLPALAAHFTVHQLLVGLDLADEVSVVGHDIGTMVAYAYAAAHRDSTSRLVLIDSPLADESLYEFPSLTAQGPGLWNFGFFTLRNGLPERMVAGREDSWVDGFVDWLEVVKGGVDEQAIAEYAAHLRQPGHVRASFEYFRALHADVADTTHHRNTPLAPPGRASPGRRLGRVRSGFNHTTDIHQGSGETSSPHLGDFGSDGIRRSLPGVLASRPRPTA